MRSVEHILRVLEEALIEPGLDVVLLDRPCPEWTVRRVSAIWEGRRNSPAEVAALANCPFLAAVWREALAGLRG